MTALAQQAGPILIPRNSRTRNKSSRELLIHLPLIMTKAERMERLLLLGLRRAAVVSISCLNTDSNL
jgi:hypothetical protein